MSKQRFSNRIMALGLTLAALMPAPAAAGSNCDSTDSATVRVASTQPSIVETATGAGNFDTLVAAVKAAGLVDALEGEGPFTVFAPTDEAFAALPEGTVETLLKPENRQHLIDILTYHVVAGDVPAKVAVTLETGETLNGQRIDIDYDGISLRIDEATVIQADVRAGNGVIHVIDRVLMPSLDARQSSAAERLIERAIERGAPMYNHGNAAACAAIYMTAADGLLAMDVLSADKARTMQRVLQRAGRSRDARDQAWMLREALDEVYAELNDRRMALN